jgi:hypothetical protein
MTLFRLNAQSELASSPPSQSAPLSEVTSTDPERRRHVPKTSSDLAVAARSGALERSDFLRGPVRAVVLDLSLVHDLDLTAVTHINPSHVLLTPFDFLLIRHAL